MKSRAATSTKIPPTVESPNAVSTASQPIMPQLSALGPMAMRTQVQNWKKKTKKKRKKLKELSALKALYAARNQDAYEHGVKITRYTSGITGNKTTHLSNLIKGL